MSYTIYNRVNDPVVFYKSDIEKPEFKVLDKILESDIKNGLFIPYSLRELSHDREIMTYPPKDSDIRVFAELYRRIIYDRELVKHGFYLTLK